MNVHQAGRVGEALLATLTDFADGVPGAYVRIWPNQIASIELDAVDLATLGLAAIKAALLGGVDMGERKASDIIKEANELLKTASFGLEDMKQRPERMRSGLRNVIVFGRAVTFALQNLRSTSPDFSEWYDAKRAEMKNDKTMSYFYELRTRLEKQAHGVSTRTRVNIRVLSNGDIKRFEPKPPNARALVIGDENGGSGWEIRQSDGSKEMYYVDLPADIANIEVHLHDFPVNPEGRRISAVEAAERYLELLNILLVEAKSRFA